MYHCLHALVESAHAVPHMYSHNCYEYYWCYCYCAVYCSYVLTLLQLATAAVLCNAVVYSVVCLEIVASVVKDFQHLQIKDQYSAWTDLCAALTVAICQLCKCLQQHQYIYIEDLYGVN